MKTEKKKTSKEVTPKGRTVAGGKPDTVDLDADIDSEMMQEVLNIAQRRKRAITFKRFSRKIQQKKKILSKRFATPDKLKRRARRSAISLIRKRVAGQKGVEYAKLSPSEKVAISLRVEKKGKALIGKIATRLMPKVRKAEMTRLQSLRANNSNKQEQVDMQDLFNAVDISFDLLEVKEQVAIEKKATKHSVDVDTLFEVYVRGLEDYPPESKLDPEVYAFNRINAFLVNKNVDSDLQTEEWADPAYGKKYEEVMDYLNGNTKIIKDNMPIEQTAERGHSEAAQSIFWDYYKDVHNIRPRGIKLKTFGEFKRSMEGLNKSVELELAADVRQKEKQSKARDLLRRLRKGEQIVIATPKGKSSTAMQIAFRKAKKK